MFFLIFISVSAFQVYEFYMLFHTIFARCRMKKSYEILVYIIMYLMQTLPYVLFGIPAVTMTCSLMSVMLVSMIYEADWKKNLFMGLLAFVLMLMGEFIVGNAFGYIRMSLFSREEYYSIFGTVCLPVVQYLIVLIFRNRRYIRYGAKLLVSYWIVSLILPVFTVYLFFVIYRQPVLSHIELVISTIVLFLLNIGIVYLFDYQVERQLLEMRTEYQERQLAIMDKSVERVRKYKHDLEKHISMISVFVQDGRAEDAMAYLTDIQKNMIEGERFVESENTNLDSVLNYKLQEAYMSGIQVEVETKVPKTLDVSVYDLNRLISNLLDNSIEACQQLDSMERKIQIEISYNLSFLYIHVSNSYDPNTRLEKNNPEEHGYGTRIVKDIVSKYKGTYEVDTEKGIYDVKLSLFL